MKIVEQTTTCLMIKHSQHLDRVLLVLGCALFLYGAISFLFDGTETAAPKVLSVSLALACAGLALWFATRAATILIEMNSKTDSFRVSWIRRHGTEIQEGRLSDIKGIAVEGDSEASRILFELQSTPNVPWTPYLYTGGSHPNIRKIAESWVRRKQDEQRT